MPRLDALIDRLDAQLRATVLEAPTPIEDLSLRHMAKAVGTARSAVALMAAGAPNDACILVRAVFEQLFIYLWVVQDPGRALVRHRMVTLKQEWANAKYLEGLANRAESEAREGLMAEADRYRARAEALLAELAAELETTEKKVRDEATLRVSLKAIEVNLGQAYSLPYAYYSGYVHSDGHALEAYGARTAGGWGYAPEGAPPPFPLAEDLERVLSRLAAEVAARCAPFSVPPGGGTEVDARLLAGVQSATDGEGRPCQTCCSNSPTGPRPPGS